MHPAKLQAGCVLAQHRAQHRGGDAREDRDAIERGVYTEVAPVAGEHREEHPDRQDPYGLDHEHACRGCDRACHREHDDGERIQTVDVRRGG